MSAKARRRGSHRPSRGGDRSRRDAQGRVHLVMHPGTPGTPARLALSSPLFEEGWQNDVAVAAAGTAHRLLMEGHTVDQAAALGRNAMSATSTIAEGASAQATDRALACRAGCAHCCHQAVGVSPPEVFAIYAHLAATRSPEELEVTIERIRQADNRTRGLDPARRLSPDLPCPFLEDERCSIYPVRPLPCRGANSLDAGACADTLRDPAARAELLDGRRSIPCFLEPIRAFHAVAAGMQLALDELHGLEVAPLELTAAMRIMADAPDTVPERWLAGEDPFQEARGADNTTDPNTKTLIGRA